MVRRLLYFNGIAILAVILFHTTGWGFTAMISWTPRYMPVSEPVFDQVGSLSYFALRFIEQLIVFAIPAFLFVSGYFIAFATGRRDNLPWNQVFARIRNMLIPYTLWTLLIWAGLLAQGHVFSIGEYVVQYLTGNTTPAYYYIPLIIQFFLLSPLIVPLAKKHWVPLLIITGLIQLILQACQMAFLIYGPAALPQPVLWIALIPKWVFLARLFWFVFGVVLPTAAVQAFSGKIQVSIFGVDRPFDSIRHDRMGGDFSPVGAAVAIASGDDIGQCVCAGADFYLLRFYQCIHAA